MVSVIYQGPTGSGVQARWTARRRLRRERMSVLTRNECRCYSVELSSLLPQSGPLAHSSFAVENHGARHAFSGVGMDLGPSSVARARLPP